MMPGAKAQNHDVLAQKRFYGLVTRPDMRIKVGHLLRMGVAELLEHIAELL